MDKLQFAAQEYEKKYKQGYGVVYPESHIIRIHRQVLEWELGLNEGRIFDFGCGTGSHLKYFADNGFVPSGCDTSRSAIEQAQALLPEYADSLFVTEPVPQLDRLVHQAIDIFLANQVLYYLEDDGIRDVVGQAYRALRPGGVIVATMMTPGCWYARFVTEKIGDFSKSKLDSPRQKETMLVNFKDRDELVPLFSPFEKLHIGSYSWHVREEEGPHEHWIYVGRKK